MNRRTYSTLAALVCSAVLILTSAGAAGAAESYTLDNGMTVILKEQHGSPMISSMVFVRSGSKYESRFENGITHFLEHLLFDGTTSLTREELDNSISDLGGYINAFTRKELTAYLVLLPKQYIDYGMSVQADMLFNSTIPESQMDKERKVVIEEIKRDADAPGAPAEAFATQETYAGTDYARPVLGYQAFIENIPRDAVVAYWKRYYIPRNMTLLVIGDFDSAEMKKEVKEIWGQFNNKVTPTDPTIKVELPPKASERTVTPEVSPTGQAEYDTVATVKSTYINFSIAAPHYSSSEYFAMDLLAQYLNIDDVSPLMVALKGGATPLATEASVSLVPYEEFSRLEISALTDKPENRDSIVAVILNQLAAIPTHEPNAKSIAGIKTTVRADDIYNAAKLHYYGFMISPYIMTAGWDFVQNYAANMSKVEWSDCVAAAEQWLASPQYIATVVRPVDDSGEPPYEPITMSADEVIAYFDSTTIPQYDLEAGPKMVFPSTDSISFTLVDKAQYHREVLPNGLTVIVKTAPDNEVFAMMVLGKNRTANEPEGKAGITDFVNRCIEKGTTARSARQLSDDLGAIGAQVTLYDNPWIPYDDRYTTREFSFMKFETINEFAHQGFDLFSEMVFQPAFDSVGVENVRQQMIGVLRRQAGSPGNVARNLFYATMFEGSAFANPIMGTPSTIASITPEDLKAYHDQYYSPENMIVSIVTKRPADEVMSWFQEGPMMVGASGFVSREPKAPEPLTKIIAAQVPLEKEQVSMYLGGPLPGAQSGETVPLQVATRILSDRLYQNLRENKGLAYSVGAGASFDRGFGWYYCAMGTGSDNYNEAVSGILLEIEKLQYDGPLQSELSRARNGIWGRLMSAKLSAINQAYYLAVDEFLGRALPYDQTLLNDLAQVSRQAVQRVASRYFRTDAYVLATAGKTPPKTDR